MSAYRFAREWQVEAAPDLVQETLADVEHYPDWWPQVLAVAKIDDDTARVLCRSTLPYTLDLVLHAVRREPRVLEVRVEGDLSGWSRFALSPTTTGTRVAYEQEVVVVHRVLRAASGTMRRVMRWNHDRMMDGCERGLLAECRERAADAAS